MSFKIVSLLFFVFLLIRPGLSIEMHDVHRQAFSINDTDSLSLYLANSLDTFTVELVEEDSDNLMIGYYKSRHVSKKKGLKRVSSFVPFGVRIDNVLNQELKILGVKTKLKFHEVDTILIGIYKWDNSSKAGHKLAGYEVTKKEYKKDYIDLSTLDVHFPLEGAFVSISPTPKDQQRFKHIRYWYENLRIERDYYYYAEGKWFSAQLIHDHLNSKVNPRVSLVVEKPK